MKSETAELERFLADRNAAFRALDVGYVRASLKRPTMSQDMALAILHKSRYECRSIEPELRHASRKWLAERDLSRMTGSPLLPEGELPE